MAFTNRSSSVGEEFNHSDQILKNAGPSYSCPGCLQPSANAKQSSEFTASRSLPGLPKATSDTVDVEKGGAPSNLQYACFNAASLAATRHSETVA